MQLEKKDHHNLYCYITREDLQDLNIDPHVLTYGSNPFRKLLSTILEQAAQEHGFSKNNLPLRAEAVPLDHDELFIQLTIIEEAEELDPRFSLFSPCIFDDLELAEEEHESTGNLIDAEEEFDDDAPQEIPFSPVPKHSSSAAAHTLHPASIQGVVHIFDSYEALTRALGSVSDADRSASIHSALYYQPQQKKYFLIFKKRTSPHASPALLAALCEYATPQPLTSTFYAWLTEHCRCLIRSRAISRLSEAL
jgi:negative regulator of genetic competence, sporulation and motility